MNDICDMAKVIDLRDFYKTVTKKDNGKSDDKVPPFLSSASGSVNLAEISLVTRYNHALNLEGIITRQFQNALRMRLANTLFYVEQNMRWRNLGKNILNIPL